MPTILVVEDDAPVGELLRMLLERVPYRVSMAPTGLLALTDVDRFLPDLVILDMGLPDIAGLDVLQAWRRNERTRAMPVVVLSGRSDEHTKVDALRSGADDYICKPFSRDELLARVQSVLRRASRAASREVVETDGLRIDNVSITVTAAGRPVRIDPLGFRMLRYLVSQPNRVHTRDEIVDHVWRSGEPVDARAVYVQIRRLRLLLADVGYADRIETVRGLGYRFADRSGAARAARRDCLDTGRREA